MSAVCVFLLLSRIRYDNRLCYIRHVFDMVDWFVCGAWLFRLYGAWLFCFTGEAARLVEGLVCVCVCV